MTNRSISLGWLAILMFLFLGSLAGEVRAQSLDLARSAMRPGLIDVTYEHLPNGVYPTVFLLGENHASVKTQRQVAELIGGLLATGAVEAILVEGSSGEIDVGDFLEEIDAVMPDTESEAYWGQELSSGRIAGFEFVALTRRGTKVFGVEDMAAKVEHEIALVDLELDVSIQPEIFERGEKSLREVLEALSAKVSGEKVEYAQVNVQDFSEDVRLYYKAYEEFAEKRRRVSDIQKEMILERARAVRIAKGLPELERYFEWAEALAGEVDSYNALVEKRQSKALEALAHVGSDQELRRLVGEIEEIDRQLEKAEERMTPLRPRVEEYEEAHSAEMEELGRLSERLMKIEADLERVSKQAEAEGENLGEELSNVEDGYFIAANVLGDLAKAAGSESYRLDTFFHDEMKRLQESSAVSEMAELAARDRAMVANTVDLLAEKGLRSVVLLVGAAHLEGVAAELKKRGLGFLGGKMAAADEEVEPWEVAALEARRHPQTSIFGDDDGLLPLSRLYDMVWRKEQIARLRFLRGKGVSEAGAHPSFTLGGVDVYEGFAEGLVLQRGEGVHLDRNAETGVFVRDQGSVPGESNSYYVVYDRDVAKEQVESLSDDKTIFAYHFRTARDGKGGQYRILTPRGEMDPEAFMKEPPAKNAEGTRRVVLFGEADERMYQGRNRSPLWDSLRGVNGDGHKPPPPPGATSPSTSDEPPRRWTHVVPAPGGEKPRVGLYRTLNPERAKRNMEIIERQKAIDPEEVEFIEEEAIFGGALDRLKFTPRRGDYAATVILLARNTQEFRAAVREAAKSRKLKNKQIALITCGDAFRESAELREELLSHGAVMVWMPDRQISPEGGERLMKEARDAVGGKASKDIDELMQKALESWGRGSPDDPHLHILKSSSTWVDNHLPSDMELNHGGAVVLSSSSEAAATGKLEEG